MFSVSWQRETQANRENKSGMALPAGCWNGTGSLYLSSLGFYKNHNKLKLKHGKEW